MSNAYLDDVGWWVTLRAVVVAMGVLALGITASPTSTSAAEIRVLNLQTNDIIYDPVSHRIYASVPSTAGVGLGNTITSINPESGQVEDSVFVGSEPGPLAVSDDGQFIYVSLDGAAAVRRFDIPSRTAGLQFALGTDASRGPMFAEDIEVLPGFSHAVAVSRKYIGLSPRHAGVAIYDDGVMRPNTTQTHTGSNRIEASATADLLFGYNNETTEFGFRRLSVDVDGVTQTEVARDVISGFGVDIEFEGGLVYATSGRVVDPDTLALVGTFAERGPVEADSQLGLVFFIDPGLLSIFDLDTFVLLDTLAISGMSGTPSSLVR